MPKNQVLKIVANLLEDKIPPLPDKIVTTWTGRDGERGDLAEDDEDDLLLLLLDQLVQRKMWSRL